MKIILEVSEKNESNSAPWWIIIDPDICNNKSDVHSIANSITGPWFSRKDAQEYLDTKHYKFSKNARVSCLSGYKSRQYFEAYESAKFES